VEGGRIHLCVLCAFAVLLFLNRPLRSRRQVRQEKPYIRQDLQDLFTFPEESKKQTYKTNPYKKIA
jgi:hypothetical protein